MAVNVCVLSLDETHVILTSCSLSVRPSASKQSNHVYRIGIDTFRMMPAVCEHKGNDPFAGNPQHAARETVEKFRCHQVAVR